MIQKKDNSTFVQKAQMRAAALRELEQPVVMETHGGWGKLYQRCYRDVPTGIVFEKDPDKAARLGMQRPHWQVYEADCEKALRHGVGDNLTVNFLDCDPYGESFPVIDAFLQSERPRADKLVIVVNDGLRQSLRMNLGWNVECVREAVQHFGNAALHEKYLAVCRWLIERKAAAAGYTLTKWAGRYAGFQAQMTHFTAVLRRIQ
jgi:hypothetical protein